METTTAAAMRPQNLDALVPLCTTAHLRITCNSAGVLLLDLCAHCCDEEHERADPRAFWWRVTDRDMRLPLLKEFAATQQLMPTEREQRLSMLGRVVGSLFAPAWCDFCSARRNAQAVQS